MNIIMVTSLVVTLVQGASMAAPAKVIQISTQNPAYWEYGGDPILLLGGSVEDNLFQIPDLEAHLDLLRASGGNYVRNTMSCRDDGNVWPFEQLDNGKYDLDQWNGEFWQRFERFLHLTSARDIIVQVEVWATFDYYRDCWERNPFNPKNNVTYTAEESGLPLEVNSHPTRRENNFFWSVPAERNQEVVLKYQRRFVDKMLSYSLKHGNALYCMDNETAVTPEWGKYWSEYIKAKAAEVSVSVETTEMWDSWDLSHKQHKATFNHPETYSFCDISQNNHNTGQMHWDNAQRVRETISNPVRPLNNVKIYGADGGQFGSSRDGIERFWRNIFGGLASARFHRPASGIGLSPEAQANIKSARMLMDEMLFTSCGPHNDVLSDRESDEAYCFGSSEECAVFFPRAGEILLDLSSFPGQAMLRWLEVMKSQWGETTLIKTAELLKLTTPSDGLWVAYVKTKGEIDLPRLAPSAVPGLPESIVGYLEKEGYSIPLSDWEPAQDHVAVHGEFRTPGETDWAVLASRGRRSVILVFWSGKTEDVTKLAPEYDSQFSLQVRDEPVRYVRAITTADKDYIVGHQVAYGGPEPPPIEHLGINDHYVGKASIVHYLHEGRWLRLQGAD